ncbi:MAG: methyltransferase domain-containing protein [Desulfovibrio sp.]|nr:methyltransferase domain-containing protein [Desulfovibrio sp.]MBI4961277.1 methyltransferase domain-containing protein [Desulfovibrio sp.]
MPRDGRYYPRGLFAGLPGVFPQDTRPARVLQAGPDGLVVDLNHPLAGRATSLTARVDSVTPKRSDTGGRLSHWLEEMADFGPGMQARRCVGVPTDFSGPEGPARLDETDDALFYSKARLIGHVDSQASINLCDIYSKRLQPGDKVLDLMSSMQSHLGSEPDLMVTGLGMNAEELEANPVLARRTVRDVNASPSLPYSDGEFDAVVSSLSIEYLIDPRAVVHECARVLRSGGRFMVGFSNRWFPTKANFLWLDLHEYERVGLVLDYLLESGCFKELWTESVRNWWRPADDPHVRQTWISDPVYVVGGTRV